ncbi:aconitase family protein [Streptomyces sp. NPDC085944]|uniref:aconitase family protein n=1 Tax=Streptomyces sp. NPDC085944 TaxID=3154962 RepID=UPI0034278E81
MYDRTDEIDLSTLAPLIARPISPGNVVPVRSVAGEPVRQAVIGSSANPGPRDFAIAAAVVAGRQTHAAVSFDVNPTSREILADLTRMGSTLDLITAGARIHQAGCLGCIGRGQAAAACRNSVRTFPRTFPGHWQNLTNYGVLPLEFEQAADYDRIDAGDRLRLENVHASLAPGAEPRLRLRNTTKEETYPVRHHLSDGRRPVPAGGTIAALAREEQERPGG